MGQNWAMRLLQLSDLRLDASYVGTGLGRAFGDARRASLLDTLRDLATLARTQAVDAVVIPGGLFSSPHASLSTCHTVCEILESVAPLPVLVSPGATDPLEPQACWHAAAWPDNVHVFMRPGWSVYECDGLPLTVHGFAYEEREPSQHPFEALPEVPSDRRTHIALLQGIERGLLEHGLGEGTAFAVEQLAHPGIAYWALAGVHWATPLEVPEGPAAYYAGAAAGHGFHEVGPCYVLIVEIGEDGTVTAARERSPGTVFCEAGVSMVRVASAEQLSAAVTEALASTPGRERVARITLHGPRPAAFEAILSQSVSRLEEQGVIVLWEDETVPEALLGANPQLSDTYEGLTRELEDAPDEETASRARGARRALLEAAVEASRRGRPR